MESKRRRSFHELSTPIAAAFVLLFAAVIARPLSVGAQTPPTDDGSHTPQPMLPKAEVNVASGPQGVTIYIGATDTTPGTAGTPGTSTTQGGAGGPSCSAEAMSASNAVTSAWLYQGFDQHPGTYPWFVVCDNGYAGVAWVPTNAPSTPAVVVGSPPAGGVDPSTIAASVFGIVPLPPIGVAANPDTGLVAVSSWFWVNGYDGSTLRGSRALGLTVVEVEITPTNCRWSFGDGTAIDTTSLGRPYPAESDVQHRYEQSSLRTGGAFTITLSITFSARYRVNGGAWQPLAPVEQSFNRTYTVQQLQSVLTRG